MKQLTGGVAVILALSMGSFLFAANSKARFRLVFDSGAASSSWSVTVYERRAEGGYEGEYPVSDADVQVMQGDRIVGSDNTKAEGKVTFRQLDPRNGDVRISAKRKSAIGWEETIHLQWRLPDAKVQLATEKKDNIDWLSSTAVYYCPTECVSAQTYYAPQPAVCPTYQQPYEMPYTVQQCSYEQYAAPVTYYGQSW